MISDPVYPGSGARALSKAISDDLLAYEAHRVDEFAEQLRLRFGVGLRGPQVLELLPELADLLGEDLLGQVC